MELEPADMETHKRKESIRHFFFVFSHKRDVRLFSFFCPSFHLWAVRHQKLFTPAGDFGIFGTCAFQSDQSPPPQERAPLFVLTLFGSLAPSDTVEKTSHPKRGFLSTGFKKEKEDFSSSSSGPSAAAGSFFLKNMIFIFSVFLIF